MLEYFPAAVALVAVSVAVYTDMKSRIIPNRLNYPLIAVGIVYYLILGAARMDIWVAASGAIGAAVAFGIGYALWLTGGWAGGDVKLFTALGALLPFYTPPSTSALPFFPITILLNSIIAMVPILIGYSIIRRARGLSILYDRVKISELREGMIPAELIYEKGGKIFRRQSRFGITPSDAKIYSNPNRAAGLSRHQVGVLKRLARQRKLQGEIKLKRGMPFAPALAMGVFIGVLYGDLYLALLAAFVGV